MVDARRRIRERGTSFVVRLHNALKDFNLQEAETLSDAMHKAEAAAYKMTPTEDHLWLRLTIKIDRAQYARAAIAKAEQVKL